MAERPMHCGDAQDFWYLLLSRLSGVSVTVQLVENWTNGQWSYDTPSAYRMNVFGTVILQKLPWHNRFVCWQSFPQFYPALLRLIFITITVFEKGYYWTYVSFIPPSLICKLWNICKINVSSILCGTFFSFFEAWKKLFGFFIV